MDARTQAWLDQEDANVAETRSGCSDWHIPQLADASVPVLQLSYDDTAGRFPWEEGYATPEMQPRPGTFRA